MRQVLVPRLGRCLGREVVLRPRAATVGLSRRGRHRPVSILLSTSRRRQLLGVSALGRRSLLGRVGLGGRHAGRLGSRSLLENASARSNRRRTLLGVHCKVSKRAVRSRLRESQKKRQNVLRKLSLKSSSMSSVKNATISTRSSEICG